MDSKRFHERYSLQSLLDGRQDPAGRLFLSEKRQTDLSRVRVLHAGVDTIRQLYEGVPVREWWETIDAVYTSGFNQVMEFLGEEWLVGSGGKSGYRWRLQNNAIGVIILYGSRYAEADKRGAHLKIECSPHFLKDQPATTVQAFLDRIALHLLNQQTATGCAIHLAVDVQGWSPSNDFENRLTTRSKRRTRHDGLLKIEMLGEETVQVYGDRESFLFGSASSLQFALYRKDREALKRDKLDWWESVWNEQHDDLDTPSYKPGQPVWRLEWRFHHSVINQVQEDGYSLTKYTHLEPILTNFFHYGLNTYRLDLSRTRIDPFWQLLYQDVTIRGEKEGFIVKRNYKTPGRGNEKNLALAIGNLLSIYARHGYTARQSIGYLKQTGIWEDLCAYWETAGKDPQREITLGLSRRRLVGRGVIAPALCFA